MSLEIKEITIDGKDFKISQFGAVDAFKIQAKLLKKLTPILASGVGLFDDNKNINVKESLEMVMQSLEPDEMLSLVLEILKMTYVDGSIIDKNKFDVTFQNSLTTVYKLLYEVIRFNYGDFFLLLEGSGFGNLKATFQKATSIK